MSRSVGGILSSDPLPDGWVAIHLSGLPGDIGRAGRPTLDLAPGGVYRAARVTPDAGALLPHRCTLACDGLAAIAACRPSAVCSLLHFPSSRLDWPLASTLPCGVPTFLDRVMPGRDHPTDSPSPPVCQKRAPSRLRSPRGPPADPGPGRPPQRPSTAAAPRRAPAPR